MACPTAGSCQGLFTANTMAILTETLGMSLVRCGTALSVSSLKRRIAFASGQRIVELVRAQAPYAIFFTHWQGLNPSNGVGWEAFTRVIQRIQKHLRDQVVWMRPSAYTDQLLPQDKALTVSSGKPAKN